ncbi:hypothetical protein CAPTEDRAFT_175155 [Capitella teleta]|uniref:Uncharacterized protein n=1 Tax=Capitella teleta TaxID=283909 RepID=R7TJ69_CAPTE|nr:hypothetical protein CAPTEDRAFT_175155 [Capitella teleta]|eukprot:ELT93542.1 hypothetical protein CAPTEDRAFT_175155 [Capitella teleta]
MLCTQQTQEMSPAGRIHLSRHPGKSSMGPNLVKLSNTGEHGLPIVKALGAISLNENCKENWEMRSSANGPGGNCEDSCEEELYTKDHTVIWSRIMLDGTSHVIKSFTMDTPVLEALWCSFLLPDDQAPSSEFPHRRKHVPPMKEQSGVCVVGANSVSIFTSTGRDYTTALPFPVAKTWAIKNGLLFERAVSPTPPSKPLKRPPPPDLPIFFSMLHPLDEVTPVICHTGLGVSSKTSFMTQVSHQVVFTCEQPSLLVIYDKASSSHSVWGLRMATSQGQHPYEPLGQRCLLPPHPLFSFSLHPLLSSSQSAQQPWGLTPHHQVNNLVTFDSSDLFDLISSHSHLTGGTSSVLRSPCPSSINSSPSTSAGIMRTPLSMLASPSIDCADYGAEGSCKPIDPEVCLELLWTEPGPVPSRDAGALGRGCKAFLTRDLCDQQYLCYLVTFCQHLRCVKFEESNDMSQLIFGTLSLIPAKDAVCIPHLRMMLITEPVSGHLLLYSGLTKVTAIHVTGLPPQMPPFSSPSSLKATPLNSSRPHFLLFQSLLMLSPVVMEMSDASSMMDDSLRFETPRSSAKPSHAVFGNAFSEFVCSLRDPVHNRTLNDGSMYRTSLPTFSSCPIIDACLTALHEILPRDVSIQIRIQWFCTYNAPGSSNGQSDWTQFIKMLLSLIGYNVSQISLTNDDWEYLLSSEHHGIVSRMLGPLIGLADEAPAARSGTSCGEEKVAAAESCQASAGVNQRALLFPYVPAVLFSLHMVYEESKLDAILQTDLQQMAQLLLLLAKDLGWTLYVHHYCRDHPQLFLRVTQHPCVFTEADLSAMQQPAFLPLDQVPCITSWLSSLVDDRLLNPFPFLPGVNPKTLHIIAVSRGLVVLRDSHAVFSDVCCVVFERDPRSGLPMGSVHSQDLPCSCGFVLPLLEAIHRCRHSPPSGWPQKAYTLLGEEDLAQQMTHVTGAGGSVTSSAGRDAGQQSKGGKEEEDGMEGVTSDVLKLRFSEDLRVDELRRLLQSSRPVRVSIQQRPEVSDHEFIEEQQRHLYATCIRTMALPVGRGMFTLCTGHPVATETLPIPKLCLTGLAPPRQAEQREWQKYLSHIDTPPNMNHWPQFHNGVAAGLGIGHSSELESSWILYNQARGSGGTTDPGQLTNEHAGFLLGLGLNGHLRKLATLSLHDYLIKSHEMTSVGLLLGIAAGKRGSMHMATVKLLSIHLPAFLPPTSTELDVPHSIQVAAILGLGLVYQMTAHRHVAEVLLSEIGRPPGPEMENCADRESYSLSAGLALGLVMLGKGDEALGLSDLGMADHLYHYMVGGQKRPLNGTYKERFKSPSYQIKEGDAVNVDVTAPGATLALGLMFFNTGNTAVAEWLIAPDTQILLDFVRPDFLMLRMISRGLILWNCVHPSRKWIDSNIPEIVSKYAFNKVSAENDPDSDIDFETMRRGNSLAQSFCYIVAGSCFVLGLKFAGSANQDAFQCLHAKVKFLLAILPKPYLVEQAGKSTIENCLCVVVLCLALVMAGTGNLQVMRLCRHLRSRVGQSHSHVLYGSHMAISMALALLFLGGGRYSLSSDPASVAAMLIAFFPKFPIHSNDNRYHLQALRHLYVLAAEPRLLLPRDVDTGLPCYVPLQISFQSCENYAEQSYKVMAPCLLPEIDLIMKVEVLGPRYWPVTFKIGHNWLNLRRLLSGSGNLYVKQRAGHLSYAADPESNPCQAESLRSVTYDLSVLNDIVAFQSEDIKSFSSDPSILAFAEYFCSSGIEQEYDMKQFLSRVLYECVSHEKLEVVSTYVWLHQVTSSLLHQTQRSSTLSLSQLSLMLSVYEQMHASSSSSASSSGHKALISREYLLSLQGRIDRHLQKILADGAGSMLTDYLRGQSPSSQNVHLLADVLCWYALPHPSQLSSLLPAPAEGDVGCFSLPMLCRTLQSHVPMATIMTLSTCLQSAQNTRSSAPSPLQ